MAAVIADLRYVVSGLKPKPYRAAFVRNQRILLWQTQRYKIQVVF